jgi:hypothetical protein
MRIRRIIKTFLVFLASLLGLVLLVFIFLNLPFAHRFVTRKINAIFTSSHLPISIAAVNTVLPWSVHVQGVLIHEPDGDTIIYAGMVRTGLKPLALMKKKLILKGVSLENTSVLLMRNRNEEQLNIAAAFSGGEEVKPEAVNNEKSPFEISVADAEAKDFTFQMTDSVSGIYVREHMDRLKFVSRQMSLASKTIIAKELEIEGSVGSVTLGRVAVADTASSGSPWNFGIGEFHGAGINFVFDDPVNRLRLDLLAGKLDAEARETDMNAGKIDFSRISVSGTSAVVRTGSKPQGGSDTGVPASAPFPWNIRGDRIDLEQVSFQMIPYADQADYNPLSGFSIIDLGVKVTGLLLSRNEAGADIEDLKFDLGNGFSLKEMSGMFSSSSGSSKADFKIRTANSSINIKASADDNIFDITGNPSAMKSATLSVRDAEISPQDFLCFRPDLEKIPGMSTLSLSPLDFNADIELMGSTVSLNELEVAQGTNFDLTATGKLSNIYAPKSSVIEMQARINRLSNIWLGKIMKEVSQGFSIPEYKILTLEARLTDSLLSPRFTLGLRSDIGNIDAHGYFDYSKDRFSVSSRITDLMLGKLLNNKAFGLLSCTGDIKGSGILKKSPDAEAVIQIDSLGLMDYLYRGARIDARIRPERYDARLVADDPSLKLDMLTEFTTGKSGMSLTAGGKFFANLNSIHLMKDTVIVEGILSSDLKTHPDSLRARLNLTALKIASPADSVTIQNLFASLESDSLSTDLSAGSDFFSSTAHIGRPARDLGRIFSDYKTHIRSRMDFRKADTIRHVEDIPVIRANLTLNYNKAFRIFIPDSLLSFRKMSLSISSDAAAQKVNFGMKGEGIKYKILEIGTVNARLADSAAILDLDLVADTCNVGPQPLNRIHVKSHFHNWESLVNLSVLDKNDRQSYHVDIKSDIENGWMKVSIPSGEIIMNAVKWQMNSPDILRIDMKKGTITPSLNMHTDSSSFSLLDEWEGAWQKYRLVMKDVGLSSFFRPDLLPGKPDLSISGQIELSKNKLLGSKMNSDLKLSNVSWSDLYYKYISINSVFNSDTSGNFDFDINTKLDTSGINIRGKNDIKEGRSVKARFSLIPVRTIEPFVKKYLSDLRGNVSGEFDVLVRGDNKTLAGEIRISDVNLRINALNSSFRIPEDKIKFTGKRMLFDNFRILDSLSHEMFVGGYVEVADNSQILSNIDISSSNLQVLNKKDVNNASFYGDVFIDSRLSVRGPVTSPVLKGKITLAKGTDIYFRQTENLNLSESGSVLTFESRKPGAVKSVVKSDAGTSLYNKSSVESVVEIDPATKINIDISKKMFSIDLVIQGGGVLNYNMQVNSQVNMSGKYEISEGAANLKMVGWPNKAFRLTRGGSIRWDSKLDDPELNLEAVNKVKSSYINPVDNKERYVDFDVTLKITNRLSAMDVNFTINTADQYLMSIINTMSPEEQMRQAITILLFEYIDLPGISTSSNYVSEQVNQMVTAQLNSLTKTTIKGIDISFGLDTYTQGTASGGQQTKTSLSYEVKRNLLNDRAKVEFSGIVSESGNQTTTNNTSLNNFSFEYRIDSAATKFLKVYNEHTYEDVFEGEVVKTGVGFSYRKSYPSLSDIWRKNKKVRQPNNKEK